VRPVARDNARAQRMGGIQQLRVVAERARLEIERLKFIALEQRLPAQVVDGPLAADQITYSYSTLGNLGIFTNTHGHSTSFANYNGLGQLGRSTGPNGDITDYTYYPGAS
jgi:YD repeat-containing protein